VLSVDRRHGGPPRRDTGVRCGRDLTVTQRTSESLSRFPPVAA
jgi:hypothetical protein